MRKLYEMYVVWFLLLVISLTVVLYFNENPEDKKIESEISEVSPESGDFEETVNPSLEEPRQEILEVKEEEIKVQYYKKLLILLFFIISLFFYFF